MASILGNVAFQIQHTAFEWMCIGVGFRLVYLQCFANENICTVVRASNKSQKLCDVNLCSTAIYAAHKSNINYHNQIRTRLIISVRNVLSPENIYNYFLWKGSKHVLQAHSEKFMKRNQLNHLSRHLRTKIKSKCQIICQCITLYIFPVAVPN